jgi:putative ABC transport system permease protein
MCEQRHAIPRLADRFLRFICPDHLYEEIEGDLLQRFDRDRRRYGERAARRRMIWNTLRFFRPGIVLRNKFSIQLIPSVMLYHYWRIMLRNVLRHKAHSAINIFGLSVGLTFGLLVAAFIRQELQVNTTLKDVEQLYLMENKYTGTPENNLFFSPAPLTKQAVEQYPTLFDNYYRFWDRQVTVSKGDKHFRMQSMIGDSTFVDMFGFKVLTGNRHTALTGPGSLVVTEQAAHQFFGKTDVVGETLSINSEREGMKEFMIRAVIANPDDKNSVSDFMNMDAQVFMTMHDKAAFTLDHDLNSWDSELISYIKLSPTADPAAATAALNKLMKRNLAQDVAVRRSIAISPLADYYVMSNQGAVKKLILALAIIVVFILLLAIANFVNITVAGSLSRLREVGVRKVIGGVKRQITLQFVWESVVLAGFAGVLALIGYELLHVYFGNIFHTWLPSVLRFEGIFWLWIAGGVLFTGVLAGIYPAIYLSATNPIQSLKGKFRSVSGTIQFSRLLIGGQFLVVVFVVVSALILSRQVSYFLEKDRGYESQAVLNVTSVPRLWSPEGFEKMEAAKREFLTSPKIGSVSLSWGTPNANIGATDFAAHTPVQPEADAPSVKLAPVDEDYLKVYGLKLVAGQFFSRPDEPRQPFTIVLNESAQKLFSVQPGDKIRIVYFGNEFTVAGVVRDFHFETFHQPIRPVILMQAKDYGAYRTFSFHLESTDLAAGVNEVERIWHKVFPNDPLVYTFHDVRLQELYKIERQLQAAASVATLLMTFIVLTGVVGLVSLSVRRRSKEIGIRKVLGSSVSGILVLLSREYVMIMLCAFAVGLVAAYGAMHWWLSTFQYRVAMTWWMFVVPPVVVFILTLLLVSLQSLKTALADPVKAIKSTE